MKKPNIRLGNLFKVTELINNRAENQPQLQSLTLNSHTLNSHTILTLGMVSEAPPPKRPSLLSPQGNIFCFVCLASSTPLSGSSTSVFLWGATLPLPSPRVPWVWVSWHQPVIQPWPWDPALAYEIITSTQPKWLIDSGMGTGPSEVPSARALSWRTVYRTRQRNSSYRERIVSALSPSLNVSSAWTLSATCLRLKSQYKGPHTLCWLFPEILIVYLVEKLFQTASRRCEIFIAI